MKNLRGFNPAPEGAGQRWPRAVLRIDVRPGSSNADGAPFYGEPDGTSNLVDRIRGRHVYGCPLERCATTLCRQFFTESLILAQDERWRRA